MRKTFGKKYIIDQRRRISTGYMGFSSKDPKKEQMKKTDHFVFHNPETGEVYYEELIKYYGKNCKSLFIAFPSNRFEDFFNDDMNVWGCNQVKIRKCDGEECINYLNEDIEGIQYKATGIPTECICKKHKFFERDAKELKEKKLSSKVCKCDMYLKAFILNPKTGTAINPYLYFFHSSSVHSADNIRTQLEAIKEFIRYENDENGETRAKALTFVLSITKIKRPDRVYNLWELRQLRTAKQLIQDNMKMEMLNEGEELSKYLLTTGESIHTEEKSEYTANEEVPIEAEFEDIPSDPADESQEIPENLFGQKETKTEKKEESKSEAFMNFKFNIKKTFKEDILDSQISALKKSSLLSEDEKTELLQIAEDVRNFIKNSLK
ncbi:MAG: hypothetical protein WC358_12360 [Ignavibacteria bacterium]|jgi:hypothetical protein